MVRVIILILFFSIGLLGCDRAEPSEIVDRGLEVETPTETETPTPHDPESEKTNELDNLWIASIDWAHAESTNAIENPQSEPYVLYRGENQHEGVLYVQQGDILFLQKYEKEWKQETLQKIPSAWMEIDVSVFGEHILLSSEIKDTNEQQGWLYIWAKSDAGKPKVFGLDSVHANSQYIDTLYISEQPFFIMTRVYAENGSFREYAFNRDQRNWNYVDLVFAGNSMERQEHREQYFQSEFKSSEGIVNLEKQADYWLEKDEKKVSIHVYADPEKNGSIVYKVEDTYQRHDHYIEHMPTDFKLFSDASGQLYTLGLFNDFSGNKKMIFHNDFFEYVPSLWEEGWSMLNNIVFYKKEEDAVQVISFDLHWEHEIKPFSHKFIDTKHALFKEQNEHGLLIYEIGGQKKHLSVYDLAFVQTPQIEQSVELQPDEYWISTQSLPLNEAEDQPELNSYPVQMIRLPVGLIDEQVYEVPEELENAMNRECFVGCGDFSSESVIRKFDDEWYVMNQDKLYKLVENKLAEIVTLPITVAGRFMFEKYGEALTAKDFVQINDTWVIADTYGNRVITLDADLQLKAEYSLPLPSDITYHPEKNHLVIDSLSGHTIFTTDLQMVEHVSPVTADLSKEYETEDYELLDSLVYQDPLTGKWWIYHHYQLILFDPDTHSFSRRFVGHESNMAFIPKLVPYRDRIILLFDDHLLMFNQQGEWLSSIRFPREGLSSYVFGENSYALDEAQGILYMVQGFSILKIDLEEGTADEMFRQNLSQVGSLVLFDGHIWFTLDYTAYPNHSAGADGTPNQLVSIDAATGGVSRMKLPEGYVSMQLSEEKEGVLLLEKKIGSSGDGAKLLELNLD